MAERDLQKDFDTLRKDLETIREDLKKLGATGETVASDVAKEARERLEAETQKLITRLRESADELKGRSGKIVEDIEHKVEEQPLTALLTSFGIGVAIGWLLSRR